jgi:hypothetical protein
MKIKNLEDLLFELREREEKETGLGINSLSEAKKEILEKISQIYGISLAEIESKYIEVNTIPVKDI